MNWESNYVSMREYIAATDSRQQSLIPPIPSIYHWILDFAGPARSQAEWSRFLQEVTALQGPKFRASSIPYVDLVCQVTPELIEHSFGDDLISILMAGGPTSEWMGALLCKTQRPLYVGITANLNRRVDEHINSYGGLADDLGSMMEIADCALIYHQLPEDLLRKLYDDSGEPDDEEEGFAAPPSLPRELRVAEYVAIRTGMPLFNNLRRNLS